LIEPTAPASQTIKPEANGNATRWHGYVARDGFGITRIKNHISAKTPPMGNTQRIQRRLLCSTDQLVLGQHLVFSFACGNDIF
jgi:hypothetical protein